MYTRHVLSLEFIIHACAVDIFPEVSRLGPGFDTGVGSRGRRVTPMHLAVISAGHNLRLQCSHHSEKEENIPNKLGFLVVLMTRNTGNSIQ